MTEKKFRSISAKTPGQKEFIRSLNEVDIVFLDGIFGTGKTYTTLGLAAEWLITSKIESILISRSLIGCGNELGSLPGTIEERSRPYFMTHLHYLSMFLGKQKMDGLVKSNHIELDPVEILRGRNYENCFMILDEAQNCTEDQIVLFLTRMSKGSKVVIMGDSTQNDIEDCTFSKCIDRLDDENCATIKFGSEDILRNKKVYNVCRKIRSL